MAYWLLKSEPGVYSIDDLERDKRTAWDGVRNYQARNFMRDKMRRGDRVLFYHSNAEPSGVAGLAVVEKEGYPDPQDKLWTRVDVGFVEKFRNFVSLADLKAEAALKGMLVVQKGSRLSVQPVDEKHFRIVLKMGGSRG